MIESERKVVAIYTRVSTNDQAREGHSLEEQEKRLRAMCEANNYSIYKVYTDAGISGKSTENRPAYLKMMADMKAKKFNLIVAFKMDRLSRSIVDFEIFFNEIKKYNCAVELLFEKIDTNGAAGMMFARILGIFAQFERELIKERTLIGVESAVNMGHFGGKPPLGYMHKVIDNDNKQKTWVIKEDEAKIVKEIFNMCLNGKTYLQISKYLKEKYPNVITGYRMNKATNVKEPIYRTWSDGSISVILNNKSYMGVYEHRKRVKDKDTIKILDKVPPIIDEEIFEECQENIKKNSRNYYRKKHYLFMQKLVCPKCGRILSCNGTTKSNKTEYRYYKCHDCGIYVREEMIEESLIDKLNDLFELSNVLNDNYSFVDNDTAEKFNKCRLNHKMRFAIDESIIKDKKSSDGIMQLNELWKMLDYEARANFIYEYVDNITIKKYENKKKNICKVDILDLKLKKNKIRHLFELEDKLLIDKVALNGEFKLSTTNLKRDIDAIEYIDLLKNKYDIAVVELPIDDEDQDPYYDKSLFKIINVLPSKAIEKKKTYYLYLV